MPAKIKAAIRPAGYVHFSDRMTQSLMNINNVIQENKASLDSIQDMAVELTRAVRSLEAAVIRYVRLADKILDSVIPILKTIPLVGRNVLEFAEEARGMADKILSACEMAEKVLPGVETGLTTADMTRLKTSTGDLQKLTRTLQGLLPAR